MTRFGFDWQWDYEHGTWCIYPHVEEDEKRSADDFLSALNKKLKIIQSKEKGLYR